LFVERSHYYSYRCSSCKYHRLLCRPMDSIHTSNMGGSRTSNTEYVCILKANSRRD